MEYRQAKNVVIVTESLILDAVTRLLGDLGIDGYTVTAATGKGERGLRDGEDSSGLYNNVKIETVTSPDLAEVAVAQIMERFFNNYAGIIYVQDVEVVRPKKFQLP